MSQTKPNHILVPVDLSNPSEAGLKVADDLARRFGAKLSIVYVENATGGILIAAGPTPHDFDAEFERRQTNARNAVETFVSNAIGENHGRQVDVVDAAFFADAIIEHARKINVDWICMATAGKRGWRRLLGSTTAEVVRRSPLPVLTFRDRSAEDSNYVFDDFRSVLVAVDLGEESARLLDFGVTLAGKRGTTSVVHVLEAPPEYGLYGVPLTIPVENLDAATEWTESALENLTKEVEPRALGDRRVVTGQPMANILTLEKELAPDVTVIGTHGHTGFNHLMLGSVAERVVSYATGPVLVVPSAPRP